jgi:hypothetical protein
VVTNAYENTGKKFLHDKCRVLNTKNLPDNIQQDCLKYYLEKFRMAEKISSVLYSDETVIIDLNQSDKVEVDNSFIENFGKTIMADLNKKNNAPNNWDKVRSELMGAISGKFLIDFHIKLCNKFLFDGSKLYNKISSHIQSQVNIYKLNLNTLYSNITNYGTDSTINYFSSELTKYISLLPLIIKLTRLILEYEENNINNLILNINTTIKELNIQINEQNGGDPPTNHQLMNKTMFETIDNSRRTDSKYYLGIGLAFTLIGCGLLFLYPPASAGFLALAFVSYYKSVVVDKSTKYNYSIYTNKYLRKFQMRDNSCAFSVINVKDHSDIKQFKIFNYNKSEDVIELRQIIHSLDPDNFNILSEIMTFENKSNDSKYVYKDEYNKITKNFYSKKQIKFLN